MARPRRRAPPRRAGALPVRRVRRGSPEALRLRRATLRDLDTLVRHRRSMWRELRRFRPADLDRHDIDYRAWVRRQMAAGKFLAFVVDDGSGRPVASGALWLMPSQPRPGPLGRGEVPYVLSMFTDRRHRGLGVASRIVQEMIAWARARRYARLVLHASRFGRPVYERLGFENGSEMRLALTRGRPARRARQSRSRAGRA